MRNKIIYVKHFQQGLAHSNHLYGLFAVIVTPEALLEIIQIAISHHFPDGESDGPEEGSDFPY